MTFAEIDRAARSVIEKAGWGPAFNHRLGHQIGLVDHEPGDVSATHDEPVRPGQCFSIEPGIYLPGDMGVRIEDLVIVTEDGCEVLTATPRGSRSCSVRARASEPASMHSARRASCQTICSSGSGPRVPPGRLGWELRQPARMRGRDPHGQV